MARSQGRCGPLSETRLPAFPPTIGVCACRLPFTSSPRRRSIKSSVKRKDTLNWRPSADAVAGSSKDAPLPSTGARRRRIRPFHAKTIWYLGPLLGLAPPSWLLSVLACCQRSAQAQRQGAESVLFGGNDSGDIGIPYDDYATYAAVRRSTGLAIPQSSLLPIVVPRLGDSYEPTILVCKGLS